MSDVLVVNGPNLNLLGTREPEIYGSATLADIESCLTEIGLANNKDVKCFQSNHEGELVDRIQQARSEGVRAIIINPAAYTHTSVAIRDALLATDIPFYEVHISNPHAREAFRHTSLISDVATGTITGFGIKGYELALLGAISRF